MLRRLAERPDVLPNFLVIAVIWVFGMFLYSSIHYVVGYLCSSLILLAYTLALVRAEIRSGRKPPLDYLKPSIWQFALQLLFLERFLWLGIGLMAAGGAAVGFILGNIEWSMGFLIGLPLGYLLAVSLCCVMGYFKSLYMEVTTQPARAQAVVKPQVTASSRLEEILRSRFVHDGRCVICGAAVSNVVEHFRTAHPGLVEALERELAKMS